VIDSFLGESECMYIGDWSENATYFRNWRSGQKTEPLYFNSETEEDMDSPITEAEEMDSTQRTYYY